MHPLRLLSLWLWCGHCLAAVAPLPEPVVTERGPDHKVWTRVQQHTLANGRVVTRTSSYKELGTAMHYWRDGQWVEAQPVFEVFRDGIVARQCQHQIVLAHHLNAPGGTVDLLSPDQQRFRCSVVGLAYTDAETGKNVLIASVRDSAAELIAPNRVLFRDAFEGDVKADVLFTLTREGLSQWVLLRENPRPPENYQLSSRFTRLEVWTEWLESPVPVKSSQVIHAELDRAVRAAMVDPDFRNEDLNFGTMGIGTGAAFPLENDAPEQGAAPDAPVGKLWIRTPDGQGGPDRTFLIEQIEYPSILPRLQRLPQAAALKPARKNALMAAIAPPASLPGVRGKGPLLSRSFPPARLGSDSPHILLAAAVYQRSTNKTEAFARVIPQAAALNHQPAILGSAFVLDWTLLNAGNFTNYTLKGDSTYFINGTVNLYGTTIIEGGSCVKFTNGTTRSVAFWGPIDCRTRQYSPAFFTAKDDDSVGEIIAGSTGSPGTAKYANFALYLRSASTAYDLHDLRIRNAFRAIMVFANGASLALRDSHMSHITFGFDLSGGATAGTHANIYNVLAQDVNTFSSGGTQTVTAAHVTLHLATNFRPTGTTGAMFLTNSLLISVTNNLLFTGGADVITNLSDAGIFQSAGAGLHYLAANSPYRNAGTTNMDPALLAALKQRTTYPPILLTNSITGDTNLSPQAQRDTDAPDIGYEYDPTDWLVSGIIVSNLTLTLSRGTVLAAFGNSGIDLRTNTLFLSIGSPETPNILTRYAMIQEDTSTNWSGSTPYYQALGASEEYGASKIHLRFTRFTLPAGLGFHIYSGDITCAFTAEHSEFHGGEFRWDAGKLVTFTNCLFNRLSTSIEDSGFALTGHWRNNTFYGGRNYWNTPGNTVTVFDNLFDYTTNTLYTPVTNNYNAYLTNASRLTNFGANDIVLAATSYSFETNGFGQFYLPANSPLLNAGSTGATNVGLFHFTTTTNQWKETNSIVDIGFHYVATGTNGLPVDTDGDRLPDFIEDANGNGIRDSIETSVTIADTDGDGVNDWDEFTQGRDPIQPPPPSPYNGWRADIEPKKVRLESVVPRR